MKARSIQCMFIGGFVCLAFLLWLLHVIASQRVAAQVIKRNGGSVSYDIHGPKCVGALFGDYYPFKVPYLVEYGRSTTDQDLSDVKEFRKVQVILLNGSKIQGPGLVNFTNLERLEFIDLTKTDITDDGLQYVAMLQHINRISLANNKQITGRGLGELQKLNGLQTLDLSGTSIGDVSLEALRRLPITDLDLTGTKVTREGVSQLIKEKPGMNVHVDKTLR